jgi:tRNA pseudouridine38-40 synthase
MPQIMRKIELIILDYLGTLSILGTFSLHLYKIKKLSFRYFIHLAYNGSDYHGWQVQDNAPTVQESLNKALSTLLSAELNVVGCGRTDTGVHASDFYAHFDLEKELSVEKRETLIFKLNRFLPTSIVIFALLPVKTVANTRFDAISRTYKYHVNRRKDPFFDDYSYFVYGDLDIDLMNQAANEMMKYTDFTSFSKLHTQTKTNNCKITEAKWEEEAHKLVFTIKADRFLRNMVRSIVGTLLDVGRHKISIDEFKTIIENKDRCEAGYSVPAKALFLDKVEYPEDIWIG